MAKNSNFIEENLADICASYQSTLIQSLFLKLTKAAADYNIKDIAIAGGVSANSLLRSELERIGIREKWNTFIPSFEYCTDNAAMIGIGGYYKFLKGEFAGQDVAPSARLKF